MRLLPLALALATAAMIPPPGDAAAPARKAKNVLVVTLDGFRWQELFSGADESLLDARSGGVKDVPGLKARYWRKTTAARREALMPFFWGTVAKRGQVFGNPALGARARSTNGLKFSYPGYSEMFCGFPDPGIASNAKRDNPNLSVLEFLNGRPGFKGRVEAVCTWDVFPFIFRSRKNGLPVSAGWVPLKGDDLTGRERQLNELLEMVPRYWPDNTFDVFTMGAARSALRRRGPRVLYVGLGETDEWGHGRRYDLYLDSANKADRFLAETWRALQKDPRYKDETALVVTTDHGRGSGRADWTDHGKDVPNAESVWAAVLSPDTPALGERRDVEVTQGQIAATIAALVGEDFNAASPKAAAPLPVFERRPARPEGPRYRAVTGVPVRRTAPLTRTQPRILPLAQAERPDEFDIYRRNTIVQLRSNGVLTHALKRDAVKNLAFPAEMGDPLAWLKARLRIDSPGEADLVRVGLDGDDPATLAALVNAVVQTYLEQVAYGERLERNSIVATLEKALAEAVDSIGAKKQSLDRAKESFGPGMRTDAEEQALARQILEIKRELRKTMLERARAASRPDAKAELAALEKHLEYLTGELAPLQKEKARRPAPSGEREALRDEIEGEREFARLLRRQLALQRLELQAPARVTLFQSAEVE